VVNLHHVDPAIVDAYYYHQPDDGRESRSLRIARLLVTVLLLQAHQVGETRLGVLVGVGGHVGQPLHRTTLRGHDSSEICACVQYRENREE
jgi:hypothetical protein